MIIENRINGTRWPAKPRVPLVAAGDVHYHDASRRYLQDVFTAIRLKTTVAELGANRFPNGERRLRPLDELISLMAAVSGGPLPYGRSRRPLHVFAR